MKAREIRVGGNYAAKVNNIVRPVRVLSIDTRSDYKGRLKTTYKVVNLKTKRETTFRSPSKFRFELTAK